MERSAFIKIQTEMVIKFKEIGTWKIIEGRPNSTKASSNNSTKQSI